MILAIGQCVLRNCCEYSFKILQAPYFLFLNIFNVIFKHPHPLIYFKNNPPPPMSGLLLSPLFFNTLLKQRQRYVFAMVIM